MTIASQMEVVADKYRVYQPIHLKHEELEKDFKEAKDELVVLLDTAKLKKTGTKFINVSVTERTGWVVKDPKAFIKALTKDLEWQHAVGIIQAVAKEYEVKKGKPMPGTELVTTSRYLTVSGVKAL